MVNAGIPSLGESSEPVIEDENWSVHGQSTYIQQHKDNFNSPYFGAKSLLTRSEGDISKGYTFTTTAFLGARLWKGTEVYYNPEMFQGIPFSGLSGLGGLSNGELQKGAAIPAIYYNARLFVRQTIGFGGGTEHLESGPNQLAGDVDKHRLVLTLGTMSALDYFDANKYTHDPRTQFMNWSMMAMGAYDYAASSRGYTYGVVGEYFHDEWTLRMARLAMPIAPNTLTLRYDLMDQYGDQAELTHAHEIYGQPGKIRVLVYRDHGLMGTYQDAVNLGQQTSTTPDLFAVRNGYQNKFGYGINFEQSLAEDVGAFGRWSWNDGKTEIQAFTDIGQSLSGGLSIQGNRWGRANDTVGMGFAVNAISSQEKAYLKQGGVTMFIGDGNLNYAPERVFETYYNFNVAKGTTLTADFQHIENPGYNHDRGPVNFVGVRAHIEF